MTYKITRTESWVSTESDARSLNPIEEEAEMIAVAVEVSNATNAITFTNALADPDGVAIYSKAAIAENATDVVILTADTRVPMVKNSVVTLTPSGDPGASGVTVTVHMYLTKHSG